MDGEVAIQPEGFEQPFVYRGFRMVDEEKVRNLRGDELRKMNQNGMLPLIFAHLFSLSQMRDVFARQMQQGKAPSLVPQPARRDRLSLYSAAVAYWRPSSAWPSSTASVSTGGDLVEPAARASAAGRRDNSVDRFRSEARGRRSPGRAWRSMTWPPANGSLSPASKPERRQLPSPRLLSHSSAVVPRQSPNTIGGDADRAAAAWNGSRAAARSRSDP